MSRPMRLWIAKTVPTKSVTFGLRPDDMPPDATTVMSVPFTGHAVDSYLALYTSQGWEVDVTDVAEAVGQAVTRT